MTSASSLQTATLVDDLTITRTRFGPMQLAGPNVFGPPQDRDEAIAVLRCAAEAGITHIDTADFYGPAITVGGDPRHLVGDPPTSEHRRCRP